MKDQREERYKPKNTNAMEALLNELESLKKLTPEEEKSIIAGVSVQYRNLYNGPDASLEQAAEQIQP